MPKNMTEIIREVTAPNLPSIMTGRVIGLEPLRVQAVDDASIRLSTQSLVIPSRLLPLEVGEEFYMLSLNNHKIYYVLDRT